MSRFATALLIGLVACNAPDSFYRSLNQIPQVAPLKQTTYAVGDTLALTGLLGGPGAKVQVVIGGVTAAIVAQTHRGSSQAPSPYPGTTEDGVTDSIDVLITAAMGVGINRPITITVDGIERNVGLIEILAAPPVPARSDTIQYADTAFTYLTYQAGGNQILARGRAGDGRLYLLSGDTLVQWVAGARTVLRAGLADQYGPFHVIGNSGTADTYMGVDDAGQSLYASLITSDTTAISATSLIFRLIKIDLHTHAIQTLNRTVFPMDQSAVTPAYAAGLTMTGPVGSVFLPPLAQIFPAANGSIYFVANAIAPQQTGGVWASVYYYGFTVGGAGFSWLPTVGQIDASGTVSYLVKSAASGLLIVTTGGVVDLLPAVRATGDWDVVDCIDPDQATAYAATSGRAPGGVYVDPGLATAAYDLERQQLIGTFSPNPNYNGTNPGAPTNTNGLFTTVDGPWYVMGCVRGGGHRVWGAISPDGMWGGNGGVNAEFKIVDFDALTVTPYAWVNDVLPFSYDYNAHTQPNDYLAFYPPSFVASTPKGDPIVAYQVMLGGPSYVFISAATGGGGSYPAVVGRRPPR